jgi:hypothetical protein
VAGVGNFLDSVVDQFAQGGEQYFLAQVHRRPKPSVLDIIQLGDVSGVVAQR